MKYFPITAGHPLQEADRRRQGRRRRHLRPASRRDARPGRRVRLRQVDARQAADGARAPDRGRRRSYNGQDIFALNGQTLRRLRRQIQIVLQDPYTSLNPRMTVGDIVGEPFEIHPDVAPKGDRKRRVQELLEVVGLNPELHQPVPAPVLRRAAPAHRHRPRARAPARDHHLRRAGVRAGRVGAGAGDEPARGPAERVRPLLHLHRARPVGRPPHR